MFCSSTQHDLFCSYILSLLFFGIWKIKFRIKSNFFTLKAKKKFQFQLDIISLIYLNSVSSFYEFPITE